MTTQIVPLCNQVNDRSCAGTNGLQLFPDEAVKFTSTGAIPNFTENTKEGTSVVGNAVTDNVDAVEELVTLTSLVQHKTKIFWKG